MRKKVKHKTNKSMCDKTKFKMNANLKIIKQAYITTVSDHLTIMALSEASVEVNKASKSH